MQKGTAAFKRARRTPSFASMCGAGNLVESMQATRIAGADKYVSQIQKPSLAVSEHQAVRAERKLRTSLETWLQQKPEDSIVHVLVASSCPRVVDEICRLLTLVAGSNVPFGLPMMELRVCSACDDASVRTMLEAERPFDLALLSETLLDDFTDELDDLAQPTILIAFNDAGATVCDSTTLYRSFGVHDALSWPRDVVSLRGTLHKWMPRPWWQSPLPSPASSCCSTPRTSPRMSPRIGVSPRLSPRMVEHFHLLDEELISLGASPLLSPRSPPRKKMLKILNSPLLRRPRAARVTRVLLASSCELSAATLVDYCAAIDIVADVVSDADEAMAALQHARLTTTTTTYELVIVDPDDMPGAGGYALCSWLRQRQVEEQAQLKSEPALPRTDILVLSAAPDAETCAAFGAHCCLAKPLSALCFARAISSWLATRQQERQLVRGRLNA